MIRVSVLMLTLRSLGRLAAEGGWWLVVGNYRVTMGNAREPATAF